jgi:hypothetical protein
VVPTQLLLPLLHADGKLLHTYILVNERMYVCVRVCKLVFLDENSGMRGEFAFWHVLVATTVARDWGGGEGDQRDGCLDVNPGKRETGTTYLARSR